MDAFLKLAKGLSPSSNSRDAAKSEDQGQGEEDSSDTRVAPAPSPGSGIQRHDSLSSAQSSMQPRKSVGAADAIEAALSSGAPGTSHRAKASHGRALSDAPSITCNVDEGDTQPQLEAAAITMYNTDLVKDQLRKQVAVNEDFICYALKTGHIRVLSKKQAGHKALIKGLQAPVTDLQLFRFTEDRLAASDAHGNVMAYELTDTPDEIVTEQLFSLRLGSLTDSGAAVHVAAETDMLAVSSNSGVLVIDVRAACAAGSGPREVDVNDLGEGLRLLQTPSAVTALSLGGNGHWLAGGMADGSVRLWQRLNAGPEGIRSADPRICLAPAGTGHAVGSLNWIRVGRPGSQDGDDWLLVGDSFNRSLQLYSCGGHSSHDAQLKQSLQLDSADRESGLCNAIAVQPETGLVVLANIERKAVYVLHVKQSADAHFDYMTKYKLGWPILSMEAEREVSNGVARLFCVQTHAIQAYSLQLADCVPPPGDAAAPQQPRDSSAADGEPEFRPEAPAVPDVMPSHALADSKEEDSKSRPMSAGSAGAAGSPELDSGLPRPPPPVTTPPAAAVPQPRLLTPKQLKQLAGSLAGSLGSTTSTDAVRDGQPGSGQPFGLQQAPTGNADAGRDWQTGSGQPSVLQRAPTPPVKPPSPALSGGPAAFGDRAASSEARAPPASSLPMYGGTIAGGDPVTVTQALDAPSPAQNSTATPPVKILKRKKDEEGLTQPDSEGEASQVSQVYAQSSLAAAKTQQPESTPPKQGLDTPAPQSAACAPSSPSPMPTPAPTPTPTPTPPTEPPTLPPRMAPSRTEAPDQAAKLDAIQKKLLLEMKAAHANQLKTLRADMSKETKRIETATQAQVNKLMQAQKEQLADERAIILAEHKKELQTLVSVMSASVNRDLPNRIEGMVTREVQATFSGMQRIVGEACKAAAQAAIAEALPHELAGPGLQAALERSLAAQMPNAVAQPLQDGFRASFQGTLLPAFESACQTMFSQVQATFAGGLAEHLQAAGGASASIAASLRDSVSQMSSATERLNTQVAEGQQRLLKLAEEAADSKPKVKALTLSQIEARVEDPTIALKQLLKEHKYEEAFGKVLDMSDVDRVTWLCQQLDPAQLLNQEPLPLSQSVLLSLMQQLGSQLGKDTQVKLLWIKEAAPNLEPNDALLAPHMREILQTLYHELHACLLSSPPQQARTTKVVVHLVNSLLHQCQ